MVIYSADVIMSLIIVIIDCFVALSNLTPLDVSGGRNFSACWDQCTSTYCFSRTDASCRMAKGPWASTVNSAR